MRVHRTPECLMPSLISLDDSSVDPPAKAGSMMIPPIIELSIYVTGQQPVTTEENTFELDDVQGVSLFSCLFSAWKAASYQAFVRAVAAACHYALHKFREST